MSFSGHNRGASTILYFMTAFINLFSFYRYEWKDEIVGSWLIKFIAQDNCQVRSHIYTLTYISCSAQSIRTIDRRSCHVSLGHINQVGLKGKHTVGLVTCLAKFPHGYGWNYKVQWRIQNVALMGGMRSRSLSVTRCLPCFHFQWQLNQLREQRSDIIFYLFWGHDHRFCPNMSCCPKESWGPIKAGGPETDYVSKVKCTNDALDPSYTLPLVGDCWERGRDAGVPRRRVQQVHRLELSHHGLQRRQS